MGRPIVRKGTSLDLGQFLGSILVTVASTDRWMRVTSAVRAVDVEHPLKPVRLPPVAVDEQVVEGVDEFSLGR